MAKKYGWSFVLLLMLLTLLLIIAGKIYLGHNENILLYVYGSLVTVAVFFTFLITHIKYKDPAELALAARSNAASKTDAASAEKPGIDKLRTDNPDAGKEPFVSCIFAVYNDEDVVESCIYSLLNSTYKNKEIIVVNDASTDNTRKILEKFRRYKQVRIINLPKNIGKKKAIAEGIHVAKGSIFVFTDSDSVVAEDAIERIVSVFVHDPDVGAVSGHGRALNADENIFTKIQDTWYETQFSIEKAFESSFGSVSCVSGPLAVFRKEAIYNYIPAWMHDSFLGKEFRFATDRQLTGYVLGSRYIGKKLKKRYADSPFVKEVDYPEKNWKVLYSKSARVWTVVPNTFKKIIRQHIRWKKSFIRNLFFTGTFYWRKHPFVALKYYSGALFTLVGPLVAVRHIVYLPLQGSSMSAVYYLGGILFVGSLYAIAFKFEEPDSNIWIYRPLMSLLSTIVLSWLIIYSLFTIRKPVWHRG